MAGAPGPQACPAEAMGSIAAELGPEIVLTLPKPQIIENKTAVVGSLLQ